MARMPKEVRSEVLQCRTGVAHFARHLRIRNEDNEILPLTPLPTQQLIWDDLKLYPWVMYLKARQLGSTTGIAAWCYQRAYLHGERVLVLAQTREAAEEIFGIYQCYYDHLPSWLSLKTDTSNVREMRFPNGGRIKVDTSFSESGRGGRWDILHCTEVAFWRDLAKTRASVFRAASRIILESTARGLNQWYTMWNQASDEDGFYRRFFSWSSDPRCTSTVKPQGGVDARLLELGVVHHLSKHQLWWAQRELQRLGSDWNKFCQENPLTADMAFVSSGTRFLPVAYPGCSEPTFGVKVFKEPLPYRVYSMGVDPNHGTPDGDKAAWCILDVTRKEEPTIVATFYGHPSLTEFNENVLTWAQKYNALVCVESNAGMSLNEYLSNHDYPHIYVRSRFNKVAKRLEQSWGFAVGDASRSVILSRLHEYIANNRLNLLDPRLQYEANSFVWNGKRYEAEMGHHDDLIFALAYALEAMQQCGTLHQVSEEAQPHDIRTKIQWELAHGRRWQAPIDGGVCM